MPKQNYVLDGKRLTFWDEYKKQWGVIIDDIDVASDIWLNWLNNHKSFRFIGFDERTISVRKEPRRSYGQDDVFIDVWYAYKTVNYRRRKKYIGVVENVTVRKLRILADELNAKEPPAKKDKSPLRRG